jgi:peptidoglycan/LPS O-acetylase OafA/YrhL
MVRKSRWPLLAAVLGAGSALTALPIIASDDKLSALVWVAGGIIVGSLLGVYARRNRVSGGVLSMVSIVLAVVAGQAFAEFVPEGPWFAAVGATGTVFVLVVAIESSKSRNPNDGR